MSPAAIDRLAAGRILVLDNDDGARTLQLLLLTRAGHEVTGHRNPDEVLAQAAAAPEVLVLEYALPGMNGLDVAREVRRKIPLRFLALVTSWVM